MQHYLARKLTPLAQRHGAFSFLKRQMAEQIVVMNAGRIEQIGDPLILYEKPESEFVATFIGSPKMNLNKGAAQAMGVATMGVRPEHLDVHDTGKWSAAV